MYHAATVLGLREPQKSRVDPQSVFFLMDLASVFKAADPRDYVYGLVGLSVMDTTPDYSSSSSAHTATCDYIRSWLSIYPTPRLEFPCKLAFLTKAGTSLMDYPPGFPTWVPNYAETSSKVINTLNAVGLADPDNAISASSHMTAQIIGTTLRVPGVVNLAIDQVTSYPTWIDEERPQGLLYLRDFLSRHPKYNAGIPPLQALINTLLIDDRPGSPSLTDVNLAIVVLRIMVSRQPDGAAELARIFGLGDDGQLLNWFLEIYIGPDWAERTDWRACIFSST